MAIVDDSQFSREGLRTVLEGFLKDTVLETFTGGTEILASMEKGERYDLVLMDGVLTDGPKGPDYTAEILKKDPKTAVVGISSDARLRQKFIDAGARTFLPRETEFVDVLNTIKNILGI